MQCVFFIFALLLLSGCDSSVNIHKEWLGIKYYRIDFSGHEIKKLPQGARRVKEQRDVAIGILDGNGDTGEFIVSGRVTEKDYVIEPMNHLYDYSEGFITTSRDGKVKPFITYKMTNKCQPDDTYSGVSDSQGRTILFATEKPCEVEITFPREIHHGGQHGNSK